MTCQLEALKRIRVYEEAAGVATFGIDHSGTLGDFLDFPAKAGSIKALGPANEETLSPGLTKTRKDIHDVKVIGRNSSSLSVACALHSHGVALDGVNAAPTTADWGFLRVMKAIFGGTFASSVPAVQTEVQAASTTTVINVTAGHGNTRFSIGDAVAARVVAGSLAIECREVTAVAANSVTVDEAFSAIPITGSILHGCVSIHLTQDPDTSLQFVVEGTEPEDRVCLMGMQLKSIKLSTPVDGKMPELAFEFMGADGVRMATGTVGAVAPSYYSPITSTFAELRVPTVAATTRVLVDQSAQSVEMALAYEPQRVGTGVNGIRRFVRKESGANPFAKGAFTTIFEDSRWETLKAARTAVRLHMQYGNLVGSTCLISQRTAQIINAPPAAADVSLTGQQVSYESREPTAGTNDKTSSVITFHFF
jgi:hypothetical protein